MVRQFFWVHLNYPEHKATIETKTVINYDAQSARRQPTGNSGFKRVIFVIFLKEIVVILKYEKANSRVTSHLQEQLHRELIAIEIGPRQSLVLTERSIPRIYPFPT